MQMKCLLFSTLFTLFVITTREMNVETAGIARDFPRRVRWPCDSAENFFVFHAPKSLGHLNGEKLQKYGLIFYQETKFGRLELYFVL